MKSTPLQEWVAQHAWSPVVISDIEHEEAIGNLHRLTIEDVGGTNTPAHMVLESLNSYTDIRRIVVRNVHPNASVRLYMWHDEQAGALCVSCTSSVEGPLPFSCDYSTTDVLEPIVAEFLESPYNKGIPWEDVDMDAEGEAVAPLVLPVYVQTLTASD